MDFYRHSGAVAPAGLVLAILAGLVTAGVLGVVYTYAIVYIPFIYINFLLTAGFGFAIGFAVGWAARVGKIRNSFVTGLLGFLFGLLGLYVAWAADPLARIGGGNGFWAFDPNLLLGYMRFLYENGAWTLFGDAPVTGIFLAIVWIIEAAVILGAATIFALVGIAGRTFCERCNQWTTVEEGVQRVLIRSGQEQVLHRVLNGEVAALNDLTRAPADASAYLRLDLARCDTCTESNYLSIEMVAHTVDKEGKPQANTETLVANLVLSEADLQVVREAGREPTAEELRHVDPAATRADAEPEDFQFGPPKDEEARPEDFDFDRK